VPTPATDAQQRCACLPRGWIARLLAGATDGRWHGRC